MTKLINPMKPSGHIQNLKSLHSAHTVYLFGPYQPHDKKPLLRPTTFMNSFSHGSILSSL
jgi:hypothetical protein